MPCTHVQYSTWVEQDKKTDIPQKKHFCSNTPFLQQCNATDSCLVCEPPHFHILFSLAIPCTVFEYIIYYWFKINLCTKLHRLITWLVFWSLWLSKITLNLTFIFLSAWNLFGDLCRLNAHMLWPLIWDVHEIGSSLTDPVEYWCEQQSSQYNPPKSLLPILLAHKTASSNFASL